MENVSSWRNKIKQLSLFWGVSDGLLMERKDCVFEGTLETHWQSPVASHFVLETTTGDPGNQNQPVEVWSWGLHPQKHVFCLSGGAGDYRGKK